MPSRSSIDANDDTKKSNKNSVNLTVIVAAIALGVCSLAVYIRTKKKHEARGKKSEKEEEQL